MSTTSSIGKEIAADRQEIEKARRVERRRARQRLFAVTPRAEVGKSRQSEYVDLVVSDPASGQIVAVFKRS